MVAHKVLVDLEYPSESLLPPCPAERLREFERWLSEYWETRVRLPASYTRHILQFHGGCPGKACFRTPTGNTRMIGRFFNFVQEDELEPPFVPSWRQWSGEQDVRLDYRVEGFLDFEFWCVRLEEAGLCLPIAGLDTAGHNCRDMDEMDLLCLDFSNSGDEPAVVVWEGPGFEPVQPVAPTFCTFLEQLQHCPSGLVSGPADNW